MIPQVAALAHDPQAMEEARQTVADADATLAVAKQQVAALEAETKPLEQVRRAQGSGLAVHGLRLYQNVQMTIWATLLERSDVLRSKSWCPAPL